MKKSTPQPSEKTELSPASFLILLADDISENITALENLLEEEGRTFLAARDGKEALKLALNEPVDLLITDVNMPVMNGYELTELLKANEATRHIPVILVTAMMKERDHALKGYEEGALDYLIKPLDPMLTRSKVKAMLSMIEQGRKKTNPAPMQQIGDNHVFVKSGSKYVKIIFDEIYWLEAEGDYVIIHSSKGKHIVHSTMKTIEEKLPASLFIRIHRSYIVNLSHVQSIHDYVISVNGATLAIGKSYQQKVMEQINKF